MKILAVDTASQSCSVGIINDNTVTAEITSSSRQTHSRHLMDMIDSALKMSGFKIKDIDGFAVTRGPGSFTGLRIGISTVKGLALASGRPVAGVSNLKVLASHFYHSPYLICIMIDARKGEVYCAKYRFEKGLLIEQGREQVLSPEKAVSGIDEQCIFSGNGSEIYKTIISDNLKDKAFFAPAHTNIIRASDVAVTALPRLKNGDYDNLAGFSPSYVRKADAEPSSKTCFNLSLP
ncbi:tRNA threonylcarbamoyladenosine biosynthesis protein [Desulfonema limicola]|uniref:tRNA threonylcarbamoyladenosine biosynthesis protein n=1 Tax=Desulfonema limicola TaxID=45656 RepID=A0A975GHN2_9BACT|nr:tRNA (adenosine(37)-N6)-threonylcarbamoyltransferase complex dimerization subunit type 1 TsaB [Desulfonema limicola]QTA81509.1 tRNA threonylcarbamoyladenosine biosynthesis protein [Desulfonema limicola]